MSILTSRDERVCGGTGEIWRGYPPRIRCWACGGTGAPDPRRPR